MAKKKTKPINRRKQTLRDQKTQRKNLSTFLFKSTLKASILILALWLAYTLVRNFEIPYWLKPKPTPVKIEPQADYHLEYNFYSLLPKEKIISPSAYIPSSSNTLIIQVASFKNVRQAKALVRKLQKLHFSSASYDKIHNKKGQWFRVLLGPLAQIEKAKRYQRKLRLNGLKKSVIKSIPKK